jgi:glycosyltransferase involved in cell wall biosynthesis
LGARRLADPRALLRLQEVLQQERPHVVHAHGQDASILAAMARQLSPVPLAITRHVLKEPSGSLRQVWRARMALWAMRRADAVVAVSEAAADQLSAMAGLPRPRIRVIPNGVEQERFRSAAAAAGGVALRSSLGIAREQPVVLVPAALRDGKGHDVVLKAASILRQQCPGLRVVLAGCGEREALLRKRAAALADTVIFLGACDDMPAAYASCDLVLLASQSEALPTVLIEAAAAGRPVVATRVGGTAEVVVEDHTGLLVPPEDATALAAAALALLTDKERARDMGSAAQRHAEANFSIDLQVKRTVQMWSELVE